MRRLFLVVGIVVAGSISLAVIGCAAPFLILLGRAPRHHPRAEDLDAGPDDPGVDVDGDQSWRDAGCS